MVTYVDHNKSGENKSVKSSKIIKYHLKWLKTLQIDCSTKKKKKAIQKST